MNAQIQPRLGELLREARKRLGLTQAQVAEAVGIVPAVYGRLERGTGLPSVGKLKALCDELELSADALLALSSNGPHLPPPPLREEEESVEMRGILANLRHASPKTLFALDRLVRALLTLGRPKKLPPPLT